MATNADPPLKRTSSFRRLFANSLRRPKAWISGRANPNPIPEEELCSDPQIIARGVCFISDTPFLAVKPSSLENLRVFRHYPREEKVFPSIKQVVPPSVCPLVRYFPSEGKAFDKNCKLHSFERKRRAHQLFVADHHAKETLFCPLQASQVELGFQSYTKHDTIIRVHAPNGETSPYLYPTGQMTLFSPNEVGCGHGTWVIEVAIRSGCRFRHVATESLFLQGNGYRYYHIDPDMKLRLVERAWLEDIH